MRHCASGLQHSSDDIADGLHSAIKVGKKTERQGGFIENLFRCVVRLHVVLLLGEDNVEDSVRAAACLIHVGCSHSPTNKQKKKTRNMMISIIFDAFTDPYSFRCLLSA